MHGGCELNHEYSAFIDNLIMLRRSENRGALAALRKGLGKEPGTVPEMFEHVVPFLPKRATKEQEDAFFLIASLFASYPEGTGQVDMGRTFRTIRSKAESDSIEGRFVGLLKCHRDNLPDHLRHAVALARSKDAPIDWYQLLLDVQHWDDASGSVQRRWARSFWEDRREKTSDQDKEE